MNGVRWAPALREWLPAPPCPLDRTGRGLRLVLSLPSKDRVAAAQRRAATTALAPLPERSCFVAPSPSAWTAPASSWRHGSIQGHCLSLGALRQWPAEPAVHGSVSCSPPV